MIVQLAGNGRVLVTVNEDGEWDDLFYPYPGQFQHLREMRLGLFDADAGKFQWLRDGPAWLTPKPVAVADDGPVRAWEGDGLKVTVRDRVHPNHDLVLRSIEFAADRPRRLRLFAYHSLNIAESLYQETAYVDPAAQALVHYKRRFYFEFFSDPPFDHAVCGEHTLKGLQGTYVDAEDGVLDGRAIAHGAADSVIEWDLEVVPGAPKRLRILLAIGASREAVRQVHEYVRAGGAARFEAEAEAFWRTWTSRRLPAVPANLSEKARALYRQSILVMRHASGTNGSIIASPDTRSLLVGGDTYNYCWWRDGGYISKAMDEAGLLQNARRFLDFAASCQSPDGSFLHRHFPDGAIGSTWHPPPFLQIDQTATVIAATWHHFKRGADPDVLLDLWPMVKSAANFLCDFRDPSTRLPAPSFDLWEERSGIHTYSTAAVIHALERAARIADQLGKDPRRWRSNSEEMHQASLTHLWDAAAGRFLRSLQPRDDRIDASVLLALKLGLIGESDPRYRATVETVEQRLWDRKVGGLARYEGDAYYGPENPWIVCTLWLAEARLRLGERDRCRELLEWCAERATPTLMLPEQVDAASGDPRSATPLVWSHSTFVDVVHKYREAMHDGRPSEE